MSSVMSFGLDWAYGDMSVAALRAAGADFIGRYASTPGNPKNLTAREAERMSSAGLDILLVFETTAGRALAGREAGSTDAASAKRQATAVGMPGHRPIFFAVDFDATPQQQGPIDDYFRGVGSVLGLDGTGAYGGYWVVKRLFDADLIRWGWQTYAWSGGNWDARAHVRQFSNGHTVGGVDCDYNHGLGRDFGQWRVGAPPPPAPPQSNPHLPLVIDGVLGGQTVAAMQWAMSIPDDGVFGDQTKRALQRRLGVTVDGIVGPLTVGALQRHVGARSDGLWGPDTTRHLQQSLKRGSVLRTPRRPGRGSISRNRCAQYDEVTMTRHVSGLSAFAVLLALAFAVQSSGAPGSRPSQAAQTGSWRALPGAPIVGRLGASAVWTGREMIVWGGVYRSASGRVVRARADGGAFNPASRRWRKIAAAPSGVLGGGGQATAWTGSRMVVWAGNSPDGPAAGAVYDPRTNAWRRLPRGPLGPREGYVSVWTGKELLVFGGHTGGPSTPIAAAVDPKTGSWRRLRAFDSLEGLPVANGAIWNGHEAFLAGDLRSGAPRRARPVLLAFDPTAHTLHEIGLANAPVGPADRARLKPLAWSGSEVIFSTSASSGLVRFNPRTGAWKKAAPAPCALVSQTAWIGDRLVAACGKDRLQLYVPRTDAWRTIHSGPSLLNTREGSAIAWTGTQLIVWGGAAGTPGDPTPADGSSIRLR